MSANSRRRVPRAVSSILITGWSGSGKSTLCRELVTEGKRALDTDDEKLGLCSWVIIDTELDVGRKFPPDYSATKYDWRWSAETLRSLIARNPDAFFCGNANNSFEFYPLFDFIFILDVTEAEQRHRMTARTEHDYGKDKATQDMVIRRQKTLLSRAISLGAIPIDANRPPKDILVDILDYLK